MCIRPPPGWRAAERTGKLADSGHIRLKQIPKVSRHLHGTDASRGSRRSRARSRGQDRTEGDGESARARLRCGGHLRRHVLLRDRKSTRLNSSHLVISYAVFCLKKKKNK